MTREDGSAESENHRRGPEGSEPSEHRPARREILSRAVSGFALLAIFGVGATRAFADGTCTATVPTSVDDDRDESCSVAGAPDQGCAINSTSPGNTGRDEDQNCSNGAPQDQDNSCGDCDDNHDPSGDQTCGANRGASTERDELCGHAHFQGGGGDQDGNCGAQQGAGQDFARDEGCGVHDGTYNTGWDDPDGTCGSVLHPGADPEPDRNCSELETDATCGSSQPAYSSDPDEKCSATDWDAACGQGGTDGYNGAYDEDESCGHYVVGTLGVDEACGTVVMGLIWESDANCGNLVRGIVDEDENCKIVTADPDASD